MTAIITEILERRVSSSRGRWNPRGVKRKMSNYPLRPRGRRRTVFQPVRARIQPK